MVVGRSSISDQPRSEAENQRYYDTFAAQYEAHRHDGYHRWLDTRTVSLLDPLVRGRETLEVGCGTGLLLKEVHGLAARARGIDLSDGMLDHARRRGLDDVQGSATALPFDDHAFDVVYSFKVLAHVPDLRTAFSEMTRVCRPGGRLVLELYNKRSARYWIRKLRAPGAVGQDTDEQDVFTRFYDEAELRDMLPPGVTVERIEGLRVATVLPQVFRLPAVGPAWAGLEDLLSRSPLRRFAGFLVLVLRKG